MPSQDRSDERMRLSVLASLNRQAVLTVRAGARLWNLLGFDLVCVSAQATRDELLLCLDLIWSVSAQATG